MSGKGSSPRPFSVTQEEFGNKFETIFGKKDRFSSRIVDKKDDGEDFRKCGCGRSPTGQCIGWHGLTEDEYQKRLEEFHKQDGNVTE